MVETYLVDLCLIFELRVLRLYRLEFDSDLFSRNDVDSEVDITCKRLHMSVRCNTELKTSRSTVENHVREGQPTGASPGLAIGPSNDDDAMNSRNNLPKEPEPIFFPIRYLPPTLRSISD